MNNKVYDILKWIAQIFLPALGTLYFALAGIWDFPYAERRKHFYIVLRKKLRFVLSIWNKSLPYRPRNSCRSHPLQKRAYPFARRFRI